MRFAPHTALPRVKGVHQPRDSAVFFLKTNSHSDSRRLACGRTASKRAQTVEGGAGGGQQFLPPSCSARLCVAAGRRSTESSLPTPHPFPPLASHIQESGLGKVKGAVHRIATC